MIIRVETRVFVIKFDGEIFADIACGYSLSSSVRRDGGGWKDDLRNIGGEPSDGVENDNTIRVTFENDPSTDAEIEEALRIITDHWRSEGWIRRVG